MELIYIGDHFYRESKTMMSPIYDVTGRRQDWGKVNIALRNGESVHIRQATEAERSYYQQRLDEMKAEHAEEAARERANLELRGDAPQAQRPSGKAAP